MELGIGQTRAAATGLTIEYPNSNFSVLLKVRQFRESDSRCSSLRRPAVQITRASQEDLPLPLTNKTLSPWHPHLPFSYHPGSSRHTALLPTHATSTPVPKAERKYCYLWCSRRVIVIKMGYEAMNDH